MSLAEEEKLTIQQLDQKINRAIGKAIARFDMIQPGDKLLVAVSGGKDSLCMLHYLKAYQKKSPVEFEFVAVNVDQKQPGFDEEHLPSLFRSWGVPFQIVAQDTYSVVLDKTPEGKSYCSVCSRLRRGILYETAQKMDCNKVALGHHMDDVLETFLLNTFFSGKLATMPAKYQTDKAGIEVIRPLFNVREEWVALYAEMMQWPVMPCNLCGSQDNLQRKAMKELLSSLSVKYPKLKDTSFAALHNVDVDLLMDQRWWSEETPASS